MISKEQASHSTEAVHKGLGFSLDDQLRRALGESFSPGIGISVLLLIFMYSIPGKSGP